MSSKTPAQILAGYRKRLEDRKDWLHEKINILREQKKPYGYEQEEFYAMQFVLAFVEAHEQQALEQVSKESRERQIRN